MRANVFRAYPNTRRRGIIVAMGARGSGRRPRPNHLKALDGTRESRINRDEPLPAPAPDAAPPGDLSREAQRIWSALAPGLISRRVLTADDVELFAALCRSIALYRRYAAEVDEKGAQTAGYNGNAVLAPAFRAMNASLDQAVRLAARFGLTPADRAGLRIDDHAGAGTPFGPARLLD